MKPSHPALRAAWAGALLCAATLASASTDAAGSHVIDFEDLPEGATVSTQYAAWGVTFLANAYAGADGPTDQWATNTDLTIVSSTGSDVRDLYDPPLVSGNLLRAYSGWLNEDGDASFVLRFSQPIASISVDFAGIGVGAPHTGLELFTPQGDFIARVMVAGAGQQRVSFSGSNVGSVVVLPGDFGDWVAVDNIRFSTAAAVPEPGRVGLLALGLAALGVATRRGVGPRQK